MCQTKKYFYQIMQYRRVLYYNTNQSLEALPGTYYATKADVLPAPVETIVKKTTNSFSDSLTLTEVIKKSKVFIRNLSDTITLTEKIIKKTTKVIAQALTLVENIIPNKTQFRSFNDHLTLTDAVATIKVHITKVVERITLIEFIKAFKNGILVGKWTKQNKPLTMWTKILKP